MAKKYINILYRLLFIIIAALFTNCANQVPPTGGPRDEEPPQVVETVPAHETLLFDGQDVTFVFDEFIRPATYGKEIFISPLPETRPKIVLLNKKLKIKFNEKLRDSTTYVITLTEIKDQNEGNEFEESFSLAFSTGNILDSMKVEGQVYGKYLGEPVEDITVMLFEADSVVDHDFFKLRPSYISKTNERGEFAFQNLRNTRFKIYGISDIDQSNTYSQPTELLAISDDPNVVFDDSTATATDTLYSFLADDTPPVILGYNWINDTTIIARFNEGILPEGLLMTMADTLGGNPQGISVYTYLGGKENELLLSAPRHIDEYSDLNFINVRDSLGNARDSLMRIIPIRTRDLDNEYIRKPIYRAITDQFEMILPGIIQASDSVNIFLSDTFRAALDTALLDSAQIDSALKARPEVPRISLENDNFTITIIPQKRPKPEVPFYLNIRGERLGTPDTTYSYLIKWPDPEDFGMLEGVLKMPKDYKGAIVMHMGKENAEPIRTIYDTTYNFIRLKADTYKVQVILDKDSNRVWTPGSLNPYRLPEQIYKHPGEISVRANWEFEDYEIEVDLTIPEAPPEEEENAASGEESIPRTSPGNQTRRPRNNRNRN